MSIDYEDYISSSESNSTYPNCVEYAKIKFGNKNSYSMRTERITIGRNSTDGIVDIDIGPQSFVSRKHLEVSYSFQKLKVKCLGKNGIFIDNYFKAHSHVAYELPHECTLRFPSTDVEVTVQQLVGRSRDGYRDDNRDSNALVESVGLNKVNRCDDLYVCRDEDRGEIEVDLYLTTRSSCDLEEQSSLSICRQQQDIATTNKDMEIFGNCVSRRNNVANDNIMKHSLELRVQNVQMDKRSVLPRIIINPRSYRTYSCNTSDILYGQTGQIFGTTIDPKDLAIDYGTETQKPPYSYAQLIVQAVSTCSDRQLTLNGIYNYISKNYPYFKSHDKGWQNSVRHNLSLNRYFLKVPRAQDEPGKGSFWRIDDAYEGKLITQAFRKRRLRNNVCVANDTGPGQAQHVVTMAGARASNVYTISDRNTKLSTFYSVKRTDHKTAFVVKKMNDLNSVSQKFVSVVNNASRGSYNGDKKISVLTASNVFHRSGHSVKKRLYPSTIHVVSDNTTTVNAITGSSSSSSSSSLTSSRGAFINIDGQIFSTNNTELKPIKVLSGSGSNNQGSLGTVVKPRNKYILISSSSHNQHSSFSSVSGPSVCITGSGSLYHHQNDTRQSLSVHRPQSPSAPAAPSHCSSSEMAQPLTPDLKYSESMELDFETDQFLISSPIMDHSGDLDMYEDDQDRDSHNNNDEVLWQDSSLCFHDAEIDNH